MLSSDGEPTPTPFSDYTVAYAAAIDEEIDRGDPSNRRGRRLFLGLAALLALIMAAVHVARGPAARTSKAKVDVPDNVWDVCRGDDNDDSDILCMASMDSYECACECYGFAWEEGEDPVIVDRLCGDDDDEYFD